MVQLLHTEPQHLNQTLNIFFTNLEKSEECTSLWNDSFTGFNP